MLSRRLAWWSPLVVAAAIASGCGGRTGLFEIPGAGDAGGGGSSGGRVAKAVSAGSNHACALMADGAVRCWGVNMNGELGDGSTTNSQVPVDVVGLSSGVVAVAAGTGHTCAVTRAGAVQCWGWNEFGQLGNGTTANSSVPVDVVGLSSGVVAVAAGNGFTCAITLEGQADCWGRTVEGGDTASEVVGLSSRVVSVSVGVVTGSEQACVVTQGGAAQCWGGNAYGQLGDGSNTNRSVPADVVGLSSGVVAISAGNGYTCALTTAGAVKCWGGDYGEFSESLYGGSSVPVDMAGLSSGVLAVSAGNVQACVVTQAGAAKCWGENDFGQLGDGSTTRSRMPVDVVGLSSGVLAVSAGSSFTCALTVAGVVECWGYNGEGELGNGGAMQSLVPVDVVEL